MVGVIFFLTCSPILDLGHFHKWFCQLYYKLCPSPKITPTIRCCEQHLMVGVYFFFDLFSHSGLRAFFTSDFANCTTNYAPTIRCCSQHLMVGVFFLTCSPILDLGHFSQDDFANCTTVYAQPTVQSIRCCSGHSTSDGWGWGFFLTCSPILDLGHFSQVILPIVLQIMPQPKNNPNHQVLWRASDGWG